MGTTSTITLQVISRRVKLKRRRAARAKTSEGNTRAPCKPVVGLRGVFVFLIPADPAGHPVPAMVQGGSPRIDAGESKAFSSGVRFSAGPWEPPGAKAPGSQQDCIPPPEEPVTKLLPSAEADSGFPTYAFPAMNRWA